MLSYLYDVVIYQVQFTAAEQPVVASAMTAANMTMIAEYLAAYGW